MLRNRQEITRTTDLCFYPSSASCQLLRSQLCTHWHALNSNKKPASVAQVTTYPFLRLLLVFILNSGFNYCWASDELRELEYASEIEASSPIGEIVKLKAEKRSFLSLYTETEQDANSGTVIILHPMGGHPDQRKLINPLRTYLPQHNWATLSIQMPVLDRLASEFEYYPLFDDAISRIQAAVDYLKSAGVKNIVLIGYGLGAVMALSYLNEKANDKNISALVAISLGVPKTAHKKVQTIDFMKEIKVPFLDIFAEFDLPEVTDSARKRRIVGKDNASYRQFEIEGHLFQHDQGLVVKRIYSWIRKVLR